MTGDELFDIRNRVTTEKEIKTRHVKPLFDYIDKLHDEINSLRKERAILRTNIGGFRGHGLAVEDENGELVLRLNPNDKEYLENMKILKALKDKKEE